MMYGSLIGHQSGPGYGSFSIGYHGVYKTPSGGWTGSNAASPFDIGSVPIYDDTVLLIGGIGDISSGDFVNATLNGRPGTRLVKSAYNVFWWIFTDITDSNPVISASTTGIHFSLYCFTASGLDLGTNFSGITAVSGSSNNDNNVTNSISGGLAGDFYIGVGAKTGTGATNAWDAIYANAAPTPAMIELDDSRVGVSGSGAGGAYISEIQAAAGTVSYTSYGFDSSKLITHAILRLRRRA